MNKKLTRVLSLAVCGVLSFGAFSGLVGCKDDEGSKKDTIVIMAEEMSGLFNPYYATSGPDNDVVGMTQISMLSTDETGNAIAGDDQPTVVKDFEIKTEANGDSTYYFVIKNGLKFSDGKALTMNDVMFNIYEFLDPVYTGSSTMYSTDIKGLYEYRYQDSNKDVGDNISNDANVYARYRIEELSRLYTENGN